MRVRQQPASLCETQCGKVSDDKEWELLLPVEICLSSGVDIGVQVLTIKLQLKWKEVYVYTEACVVFLCFLRQELESQCEIH